MSYITYALLLVSLLLGCLAATGVKAEDTYNFYFQKAPGPVTVNQGAAPAGQKAVDPEKALEAEKTAAAPAAAAQPAPAGSTTTVAAEPELPRSYRPFELSFGIAGSSSTDPHKGSTNHSYAGSGTLGTLLTGQYALGLQYNLASWIGLQAEGFYLKGERKSDWGNEELGGSRLDYAGTLVLTPVRFQAASNLRIALSAIGGWVTVPQHGFDDSYFREAVEHHGTPYYGVRLGFEFFDRVALQASLRRFTKYDSPTGTLALAALF